MSKTPRTSFINGNLPALIRSACIAPGIYFVVQYAAGFWSQTEQWAKPAITWMSDHGWLTLSVAIGCLSILICKKSLELLIWASACVGSWKRLLGISILIICSVCAFRGFQKWHLAGPICCMVMQGCGLFLIISSKREVRSTKEDFYHRHHLIERLAELLLGTPENIRRIGILAEWGEGKTQVMKLLETHLRGLAGNKFRMAWVNPWRANSHDEAWVEIARGVDEALGFPRLLPHSILSIPGLGSLLELLPKPFSGFTADMKTLLKSHGSSADKIATGLAAFLKRRNQWLLIFIDDMERVGPEELRKLFPVVDRLVELERCYFIFAIDPMRIAKAFKEDSEHRDETKGCLDKVLDFQMSLPMASKGEVLKMLQNRVDASACPKLALVLPKLKEYLPINPRLADRFLRDADGRERMFLHRFGPNEENYEGFFLLMLLEIQFPDAFKKLCKRLDFFERVSLTEVFGLGGSDKNKESELDKLILELGVESTSIGTRKLREIIKRLYHLCAMLLKYDTGERTLDMNWALEGYRKLIRLTLDERKRFINAWRAKAGQLPIGEILASLGEFDESELVVRQALELELEEVRNDYQESYRSHFEGRPISEFQNRIRERLDCFILHAKAISEDKFQDLDRKVFGRELFDAWMKVIDRTPLRDLPDEFIDDMLASRGKVTAALVGLLDPPERYQLALTELDDFVSLAHDTRTALQLKDQFQPLKESILEQFNLEFVSMLKSQPIADFYPPQWMKGASRNDILDPYSWLPHDANKAESILIALTNEAGSNEVLRDNFVWLIRRDFLNSYRISAHDGYREQDSARKWIKEYPWYLLRCWQGAWKKSPISGIARDMLVLRNKALAIEMELPDEKSIASILENLPVPEEIQET